MKLKRPSFRAITRMTTVLIILGIIAMAGVSASAYVALNNHQSSTCFQSAASQFYVTVVSDSTNARLSGVGVSGNVKWLCGSESSPGYFLASQNIGQADTPSNGTLLVGSIIGNYSLTLSYQGKAYPVKFSGGAEQDVNVTVRVPSDRVTVVGCTFGGGSCFNETNPGGSTLITTLSTSPPNSSNLISCQVNYYVVYSVISVSDNSTVGGGYTTVTDTANVTTTTSITHTVGYVTSTETNYTGTLTGAVAEWTASACTYTTTK